jgi:hypothetical protein
MIVIFARGRPLAAATAAMRETDEAKRGTGWRVHAGSEGAAEDRIGQDGDAEGHSSAATRTLITCCMQRVLQNIDPFQALAFPALFLLYGQA